MNNRRGFVQVSEDFIGVELETMIRITRQARDRIMDDKLLLQERELSHGQGAAVEAILRCENEIYILTCCIAKMWRKLFPAASLGVPAAPKDTRG